MNNLNVGSGVSRRMPVFAVVAVLAAMACAMCMMAVSPGYAHAAGKAKVWVLTSAKSSAANVGSTGYSTMTYTKDGLLATRTMVDKAWGSKDIRKTAYTYDKKHRIAKSTEKYNGKLLATTTYASNKKGKVVKATTKAASSNSTFKSSYKYDSKGRLKKDSGAFGWGKYAYDSKGNLVKATMQEGDNSIEKYTFTRDSKGNRKTYASNGWTVYVYKNTYKGGRLVQQVAMSDDSESGDLKTKYSYKKIVVDKSLVKKVKAQQKALLEDFLSVELA